MIGPTEDDRVRRVPIGPDVRLSWVAFWFVGLAVLEAGQLFVRLLVEGIPPELHFRDPPLWPSVACYGVGAVLYVLIGRALRRGRGLAKVPAAAVIVASLLGTYLSLNTVTLHPGPGTTPALNSLGEAWRGVGWPGILSHLGEFVLAPSGAWHLSDVAAAALTLAVGFGALWFLASGRVRLRSARGTESTLGERIVGFSLAIHLSLHAILTIVVLVGLSMRLAGRL